MAGRDEDEGMTSQGGSGGSGGGGRGGYISFADRFDGGGAGRSGQRFEGGGILSDIANMVATPRKSYGSDTGQMRPALRPSVADINAARDRVNAPYSFGRDLLDGGGLGRRATLEEINAGQGFYGGVPSMIANMVGIRPMGANDLGLVASYDAALASRPDISGQMEVSPTVQLLDTLVDAQREAGLGHLNQAIPNPEPVTQRNLDPQFLNPIRASLNQPEDALDYEMPAGLLGQVQGEAAVQDTIAQQIYDNDTSFITLDDARDLVRDPVAYQSYIDSRR